MLVPPLTPSTAECMSAKFINLGRATPEHTGIPSRRPIAMHTVLSSMQSPKGDTGRALCNHAPDSLSDYLFIIIIYLFIYLLINSFVYFYLLCIHLFIY